MNQPPELLDNLLWGNETFIKAFAEKSQEPFDYSESEICSITFGLMVRDEESVIGRCIDAIRSEITSNDEILVVDTGSTDRTIEIASAYPEVRVLQFPWRDSFAEVRNFCLNNAASDFIFFIDADEILAPSSINRLRHRLPHISRIHPDGFQINPVIRNTNGSITRGVPRILPRRILGHFYGRVHERFRLNDNTKDLAIASFNDVIIEHDGYTEARVELKRKSERNCNLLEKMIIEDPDELWWKYYLCRDGIGYLNEPARLSLLRQIYRELGSVDDIDLSIGILNLYIDSEIQNGRLKEAENALIQLKKITEPNFVDVLFFGELIAHVQRQKDAESALRKIVQYRTSRKEPAFGSMNASYRHLDLLIAFLKREIGDVEKAQQIVEELMKIGFLPSS